MNLTETRRFIQPPVARVLEIVDRLRPLQLTTIIDANFKQADLLNSQGQWIEAANHHLTLRYSFGRLEDKARAAVELIQDCNNMGRYGLAAKFADEAKWFVGNVGDEKLRKGLIGYWLEKRAWIADYEGNPARAIKLLNGSRDALSQVPEDQRADYVKGSLSTTTHFLGRQHFLLATFGIDRAANLESAGRYFSQSLVEYQTLRQTDHPDPAAEFFNHAWIARTRILQDNLIDARQHLVLSQYLIGECKVQNPVGAKGLEAHYHMLVGGWQLSRGEFDAGRGQFDQALQIRRSRSPYLKGEVDAVLGLAAVDFHQKRYIKFGFRVAQALSKYKFALLKSTLGG